MLAVKGGTYPGREYTKEGNKKIKKVRRIEGVRDFSILFFLRLLKIFINNPRPKGRRFLQGKDD